MKICVLITEFLQPQKSRLQTALPPQETDNSLGKLNYPREKIYYSDVWPGRGDREILNEKSSLIILQWISPPVPAKSRKFISQAPYLKKPLQNMPHQNKGISQESRGHGFRKHRREAMSIPRVTAVPQAQCTHLSLGQGGRGSKKQQ